MNEDEEVEEIEDDVEEEEELFQYISDAEEEYDNDASDEGEVEDGNHDYEGLQCDTNEQLVPSI